MKLSQAIEKERLLNEEIYGLMDIIQKNNSYISGTLSTEKYNVDYLYSDILKKIQKLVNLKIVISEAEKEIQPLLIKLEEFEKITRFLRSLSTFDGVKTLNNNFDNKENFIIYESQIDDFKRMRLYSEIVNKIIVIQDQIEMYRHTTDIAWDDENDKNDDKE